jgi:nicotinamidase-related amidase
VLDACIWLGEIARYLEVPVLVSEQNAKALGSTQSDLAAAFAGAEIRDKLAFSCVAADCFGELPQAQTPQVILCGIEAHVCVLQTALDLRRAGREVFVIADAVTSRSAEDARLAVERMRQAGIVIVSREMVVFEWLGRAGTDQFRHVSRNYLR